MQFTYSMHIKFVKVRYDVKHFKPVGNLKGNYL